MSKRVQVKLNLAGVRALLKSEQMAAVCRQYASRVVQRAGTGYEMQQRSYPERNGYVVRPATYQARKDNLDNNTLEKAVRQ